MTLVLEFNKQVTIADISFRSEFFFEKACKIEEMGYMTL